MPAEGTQWSAAAQEGLVPGVHEPASWVGTGATDPNDIVVLCESSEAGVEVDEVKSLWLRF